MHFALTVATLFSDRLFLVWTVCRYHVAGDFQQGIRGIAKGTAMFALLALAGDLGCSGGPTLVGFVTGLASDDLKKGILAGILFPILLIVGIVSLKKAKRYA